MNHEPNDSLMRDLQGLGRCELGAAASEKIRLASRAAFAREAALRTPAAAPWASIFWTRAVEPALVYAVSASFVLCAAKRVIEILWA